MALPSPKFDISPQKEARMSAFLCRQLLVTPPAVSPQEVDLNGKTAIVTGSNAGLGLECCRQVLGLNLSKLILAVRDESKGIAARDSLSPAKKHPGVVIEVWKLDLSSYDSVIAFVDKTKTLERLDIIVLNASVFKKKFELNPSTRHEEAIQVNYLSTALLTILLLPVIKAKNQPEAPGRIVLVSSEGAAWADFKEQSERPLLSALDKPDNFEFIDRYYVSKLLIQFFMSQLVTRVPPTSAVIAACNPGLCYGSNLHRETWGTLPGNIFGGVKRVVGRSLPIGARTSTDCAVKHGQEIHGQYLGDCTLKPMAPIIYKPQGKVIAEALWQETMAELSFAEAEKVLQDLSN
ncbi:NAD(P)-binding protein [Hypoxylon sp. FL1857]|nr:NAD(P)-binding protein [Hypoxylon sp. FL1857]